MAKITMKTAPSNTVEDLFPTFLSAAATRGVKDKTLVCKYIEIRNI